jgi:hypothetical protein
MVSAAVVVALLACRGLVRQPAQDGGTPAVYTGPVTVLDGVAHDAEGGIASHGMAAAAGSVGGADRREHPVRLAR